MKNLKKRVEDLERAAGIGKKTNWYLWVDYTVDGGIVHNGRFYMDENALLRALGHTRDEVKFLSWPAGKTAAELLAQPGCVKTGEDTIQLEP